MKVCLDLPCKSQKKNDFPIGLKMKENPKVPVLIVMVMYGLYEVTEWHGWKKRIVGHIGLRIGENEMCKSYNDIVVKTS